LTQQGFGLFELQGLHFAALPNGHHLIAANLLVSANGCDGLRTWRALLGHATWGDAAGSRHATLRGCGTGCGTLLGGVLNPSLLLLHTRRRRGTRGLTGLLGRSARWDGALHQERRHLGTMPAIKARPGAELDFDAEVARFLKALADVEALDGVVQHAMYGAMKAEDAKALVRHHTTHHFHQFQLV